jgi:hypothetical protein
MKGTSTCKRVIREPGDGETRRPYAEKITPEQKAEISSKPVRGLPVIVYVVGPNANQGGTAGKSRPLL